MHRFPFLALPFVGCQDSAVVDGASIAELALSADGFFCWSGPSLQIAASTVVHAVNQMIEGQSMLYY